MGEGRRKRGGTRSSRRVAACRDQGQQCNATNYLDENDHQEGEQAGNDRKIEDQADIEVPDQEQQDREQGAEERTGIVADAFEPKSSASVGLGHEAAISASRGAERVPAPSRSRNRARTPCHAAATPISGLPNAASR